MTAGRDGHAQCCSMTTGSFSSCYKFHAFTLVGATPLCCSPVLPEEPSVSVSCGKAHIRMLWTGKSNFPETLWNWKLSLSFEPCKAPHYRRSKEREKSCIVGPQNPEHFAMNSTTPNMWAAVRSLTWRGAVEGHNAALVTKGNERVTMGTSATMSEHWSMRRKQTQIDQSKRSIQCNTEADHFTP